MSDDSTLSSDSSLAEETPSKPVKKNVRRISHKPAAAPPDVANIVSPEAATTQPTSEAEISGSDWPEFESLGDEKAPEGTKRNKRRRRKGGKGGGQSQSPVEAPTAVDEPAAGEISGSAPVPRPAPPAPAQRPKADPELLAKFAWKIYLAEVSEEGVALIADNDARELSRRCFRLAEIFLEEQARRR
jgi:hypothetical protein